MTPEMIDRLPRVRATISAGPHTCIGMSFGVQQAIVFLAMILRVYRLDLVAGHRVTPVQRLTVGPKQIAWLARSTRCLLYWVTVGFLQSREIRDVPLTDAPLTRTSIKELW